MRICESLLLLAIVCLGVYASITDLKDGKVPNKAILLASCAGIAVNLVYYVFYQRSFFQVYLINLSAIGVLSLLLYLQHYWAAGDSKLLICMGLLIPGRVYDVGEGIIPGISCIAIIFLMSYAYILLESIIAWFRKENAIRDKLLNIRILPSVVLRYVGLFCILSIATSLWQLVFYDFYYRNQIFFALINIILITGIAGSELLHDTRVIAICICAFLLIFILRGDIPRINPLSLIKSYLVAVLALLLRYFISGYNYKEICTEEVQAGMVLSFTTVLMMKNSTIKGLPSSTSEDMRDRISEEQARAIRTWGRSNKGSSKIVIVRKIPFAVFIVTGVWLFIITRVVL